MCCIKLASYVIHQFAINPQIVIVYENKAVPVVMVLLNVLLLIFSQVDSHRHVRNLLQSGQYKEAVRIYLFV